MAAVTFAGQRYHADSGTRKLCSLNHSREEELDEKGMSDVICAKL